MRAVISDGLGILVSRARSEIKSDTGPNFPCTISACGNEEVLTSGCLCRSRARTQRLEIDELRSIAKDGSVQDVIELKYRSQPETFADLPFTANVEVEHEKTRTSPCIAREISALSTDRLKRKLRKQRIRHRRTGFTILDVLNISAEIKPVGTDVIEIPICSPRRQD